MILGPHRPQFLHMIFPGSDFSPRHMPCCLGVGGAVDHGREVGGEGAAPAGGEGMNCELCGSRGDPPGRELQVTVLESGQGPTETESQRPGGDRALGPSSLSTMGKERRSQGNRRSCPKAEGTRPGFLSSGYPQYPFWI